MRVVIGEDEALLRNGLRLLLESAGMTVVAAVEDAGALRAAVAAERPHLVVTDIRMPPGGTDDGLRAAVAIRAAHPATGVVVLSQYVQRRYATELLAGGQGRVGYLLKQRVIDVERFVADLRTVAAGGTVLDPEVVETMVSRAARTTAALEGLTDRQHEVLALIAAGHSNAAIAAALSISERGVVQHMTNIYAQLHLPLDDDHHRRVLAVLHYLDAASGP